MARPQAQRGGDLAFYQVFDFQRGLDIKTSPLKLALLKGQNALVKARNCVYNASGGVSGRYDVTKATASSVGASVKITGGFDFTKSDGVQKIVFGTDDGRVVLLNANGTTTNLATGLTTGTKWYFEEYNDKLLIGNRADAPRKYDGTTFGLLGGSPPNKGGPVRRHGNRIFWLDGLNKSRLTWSALNAEEDYVTVGNAGNFDVALNDGSDAMDIIPSINELLVLKGNRPYRLQGTSPATFTLPNLVPTSGSVGAVSSQAAFFAVNDVHYASAIGIVRLQPVIVFGDLQERFSSTSIKPYFEQNSGYTLSLENLVNAIGVYDRQWNRAYFAVDSDGDAVNDLILIFDFLTGAWSVWDSIGICSMWPVKNAITGTSEIYAGGYDGHIRILNRNVTTNAITREARHLSCLNTPGLEKSVRHVFLYFKEAGATTVQIDTKYDFGQSGGQVYTASLSGGSALLGISFVLGTSVLGGKAQIVKRVDVHGTGEFFEIGVKTTAAVAPFSLFGYEVLYRVRRGVRRGTAAVA